MKKKKYEKPFVSLIQLETEHCILVGSVTSHSIAPQVTVDDFTPDQSFPDGGFDMNFD